MNYQKQLIFFYLKLLLLSGVFNICSINSFWCVFLLTVRPYDSLASECWMPRFSFSSKRCAVFLRHTNSSCILRSFHLLVPFLTISRPCAILNVKIAEMVVHKTIIRSFHIDLHSEHKSCLLPSVEWNMKGCKTNTDLHTHHAEVNFFLLQFVLADHAGILLALLMLTMLLSVKCILNR